jgi:2,3-dihydroxybenzoate-AMP ligase
MRSPHLSPEARAHSTQRSSASPPRLPDSNVDFSTLVLTLGPGEVSLRSMVTNVMPRFEDPGLVRFDEASCVRYREAGIWLNVTLPAALVAAATTHSNRIALITGGSEWTYSELLAQAKAFAFGLLGRAGVRPGDPVMFQMGNVAETVVAYLGCLLAGARPVCTLPQHGTREIGLLAKHVGASCLISQGDFGGGRLIVQAEHLLADGAVETVIVARGGGAAGCIAFEEILRAGDSAVGELPYCTIDPSEIVVFQLSGGTTGLPKVAPRLHEDYTYNSLAWAEVMDYQPGSVVLYSLPLMHNAGISLALQPAILSGATLVLAESADIDLLLDLVQSHNPQVLPLVPPALAIRLLESERARSVDLSNVDFIVGGQRMAVEVAERLRDELGIKVRQMFGMAEGMFLLTPPTADEFVRHHTVGGPISQYDEVRILDPSAKQEVPDGELGEFAARGPYTIRGYYRAEQHNRNSFTDDGFYRTGDLARRHVTNEGTFYSIEGRIKDVINRGVEKIHAEEVEELIVRHPDVETAAVVAMPDPVLGEKACAYLIMEPGREPLTVAALGEFLIAAGLSKYKLPERIEIVHEFPLTNVGKFAKKELRADIERKLASEGER